MNLQIESLEFDLSLHIFNILFTQSSKFVWIHLDFGRANFLINSFILNHFGFEQKLFLCSVEGIPNCQLHFEKSEAAFSPLKNLQSIKVNQRDIYYHSKLNIIKTYTRLSKFPLTRAQLIYDLSHKKTERNLFEQFLSFCSFVNVWLRFTVTLMSRNFFYFELYFREKFE